MERFCIYLNSAEVNIFSYIDVRITKCFADIMNNTIITKHYREA